LNTTGCGADLFRAARYRQCASVGARFFRNSKGMLAKNRLIKTWLRARSLSSHHRGGDVLFSPCLPNVFDYTIVKICERLGLRRKGYLTEKTVIAVQWKDSSIVEPISPINGIHIINHKCLDITKRNVETKFEEIFGYALAVDPMIPGNRIVRKSNLNATHDGVIFDTPVQAEPGYVYEALINNQINERLIEDIRVPVIGNQIPYIYLKRRPIGIRFTDTHSSVEMTSPENCFSISEIELIKAFVESMGADFCELDILRDRTNGLLYIVDLNKTPYSSVIKLGFLERMHAIDKLAAAFEGEFLS
jgi:hypothetical protein